MLGSRFVGLAGLVVPAPREPLLALPTGFRPTLDVPLANLGCEHRGPVERADREPAFAHEQDSPADLLAGRRREGCRVAGTVVLSTERKRSHCDLTVDSAGDQLAVRNNQLGVAVSGDEVLEPPLDTLGWDQDRAGTRHSHNLANQGRVGVRR